MERELAGKIIVEAKRKLGLKWADIAKVIDRSEAWTASALLGQATLSNEEAEQVASLLELDQGLPSA
nr:hypothetical protein [Paenibacillus larvae]